MLQSETNIGYEDVCGMLESFNGRRVLSLAHLNEMANQVQQDQVDRLEFMLVTGKRQTWEP